MGREQLIGGKSDVWKSNHSQSAQGFYPRLEDSPR